MNQTFRTQFRLPACLAAWVKEEAAKEGRSMNAQIVRILSQARDIANASP